MAAARSRSSIEGVARSPSSTASRRRGSGGRARSPRAAAATSWSEWCIVVGVRDRVVRAEQVGPPDRADEQRAAAEQQHRLVRRAIVSATRVADVLGRVSGRVEGLEPEPPDVERRRRREPAGARSASAGAGADDVRRAGQRGELAAARHVVVVEVRLEDVADAQAAPGGRVEVDVDVAARVDDRGDPRVLVRDQRRQVAQACDRELTRCASGYIITRPPSTASTWPVMYAGLVRGEEGDGVGDLLRGAEAPERRAVGDLVHERLRAGPGSARSGRSPGATALTVMPRDASSRAVALVSPMSPAFADE